jgi:hypothetical protein
LNDASLYRTTQRIFERNYQLKCELDKDDIRNFFPRFSKESLEANQALVDLIVSIAAYKPHTCTNCIVFVVSSKTVHRSNFQEHQNYAAYKKILVLTISL